MGIIMDFILFLFGTNKERAIEKNPNGFEKLKKRIYLIIIPAIMISIYYIITSL